ncbi:DUF2381 family protein [Archangium sp.]|uniref:DUF2381 family protein n=1 Tax=Archangium sp. TaxID=1872627 RepID=UPI002D5BA98D|nr:DUF2381 family protein [Archangium sp.]HYO57123.1 DUF2381 family protein [Archangium sp.]
MLLPSAALLLLSMSPEVEVRRPYPDACGEPLRSIELSAESAWEPLEVCVSAELSTTLVFDSEVARVELEGQEGFRRMDVDEGTLVLVPTRKPRHWKPTRLTVYFQGGVGPASVTFILVFHPARLARQVEVFRSTRPEEPCGQELQKEREKNARLAQELEQFRAEYQGQGPLTRLFTTGRMKKDDTGVVGRELSQSITPAPDNALTVESVLAYRYTQIKPEGGIPMVGVALVMQLTNPDTRPWSVVGASLMREGEEVKKPGVWPPDPIAPEQRGFLQVETELTQQEARETLTLRLWDEGGTRSVTVGNVRFP